MFYEGSFNINGLRAWRFTIADRVGNDDTLGGTIVVRIMMLGV